MILGEQASAVVSEDGVYRYDLMRWWGDGPRVLWIMLNPSTADEVVDDHTIACCRRFSRAWAYDGMVVVNLFALRATNPAELSSHPDPVGPENDEYLTQWLTHESIVGVVAAWGASGPERLTRERYRHVRRLASDAGHDLYCLGLTNSGHPRHPSRFGAARDPMMLWPAS